MEKIRLRYLNYDHVHALNITDAEIIAAVAREVPEGASALSGW